jgi:hypothetical protein
MGTLFEQSPIIDHRLLIVANKLLIASFGTAIAT